MDELIAIVDLNGTPTGKTCFKSFAHKNGILHASVHIWLYTSEQKILIQKRKETKDVFPNLWDVSVAGHISDGETPMTAALRETQEEIGLDLTQQELKYLGIWEDKHHHENGIVDHEIHHLYIAQLSKELSELTLQEEEVAAIRLIDFTEFETSFTNKNTFVPHPKAYYEYIINALKKI